jgi:hypothetical protein
MVDYCGALRVLAPDLIEQHLDLSKTRPAEATAADISQKRALLHSIFSPPANSPLLDGNPRLAAAALIKVTIRTRRKAAFR